MKKLILIGAIGVLALASGCKSAPNLGQLIPEKPKAADVKDPLDEAIVTASVQMPEGATPQPVLSGSPSAEPSPSPSPISQEDQEKKVLEAYQGNEQKQPAPTDQPAPIDGQETKPNQGITFIPTHTANCWLKVEGKWVECYVRIRPLPSKATDKEVGQVLPGRKVMVLNRRVYAEGIPWVYVVNESGAKGWASENVLKRIGG